MNDVISNSTTVIVITHQINVTGVNDVLCQQRSDAQANSRGHLVTVVPDIPSMNSLVMVLVSPTTSTTSRLVTLVVANLKVNATRTSLVARTS